MRDGVKQIIKPILVSLASNFGPHTRTGRHPRLWLLMYHRVLPAHDVRYGREEPGMLIRPETLEMHIQEVKRQFDLISLKEWIDLHRAGVAVPDRACAITFDDGWLDNYQYAFPVLQTYSTPATLFAVVEKIGTDFQFWPNILANLLLHGAKQELEQHPIFQPYVNRLTGNVTVDQVAGVIKQLKVHTDADIFDALGQINWRALCTSYAGGMTPALMNWDQLCEMKQSGLVDIGSHTCTHRRLTNALSQEELEYEIVHSKTLLEQRLQSTVDLFCFPNGDYNDLALSLVKQHYRASVTTQRGINKDYELNLHELSRIGLHDEVSCSRRLFRARLSGWV